MELERKDYENRQYVRLNADFLIQHTLYRGTNDCDLVRGALKNYSSGGLLFESEVQYKIGELIKLEMTVPGWEYYKNQFYNKDRLSQTEPIMILALVMRVECLKPDQLYDIGVWFIGVDEGDRWALSKQIEDKIKKMTRD